MDAARLPICAGRGWSAMPAVRWAAAAAIARRTVPTRPAWAVGAGASTITIAPIPDVAVAPTATTTRISASRLRTGGSERPLNARTVWLTVVLVSLVVSLIGCG